MSIFFSSCCQFLLLDAFRMKTWVIWEWFSNFAPDPFQANLEEAWVVWCLCCYTAYFQWLFLFFLWTLVIIYLQNISECYFGNTYLFFYSAQVHYPFMGRKQGEILYGDEITRERRPQWNQNKDLVYTA